MNYYEKRIGKLDLESLPIEVNSDGRTRTNLEDDFRNLKVGDKLYPTVWFLRNIPELDKVADIAENGLTIEKIGTVHDSQGKWGIFGWESCDYKCYWFKETSRPMSFKYYVTQNFWKYEKIS